jgi:serine/threonine protein phosphatase 1
MRSFVIGDIHGQDEALVAVLLKCGFVYEEDRLIVLGDVYEGLKPEACIEHLKTIRHLVAIMGNHDHAVMEMQILEGKCNPETLFLKAMRSFFEEDERFFVHGGFDPYKPLTEQDEYDLEGSRKLPSEAWKAHMRGDDFMIDGFREVYVGHTPTQIYGFTTPLNLGNLWMMDTGAAPRLGGYLSVMDIDTKEFWQVKCC